MWADVMFISACSANLRIISWSNAIPSCPVIITTGIESRCVVAIALAVALGPEFTSTTPEKVGVGSLTHESREIKPVRN